MSPDHQMDPRVATALSHWAPRFVANGVPLTDFQEVTASIERWDDWCSAWSARAAIHEAMGRQALDDGYELSAGEHLTTAGVCYHFAKFLFVNDLDQMQAAHMKAVECRRLALPFLQPAGERVMIPYEGSMLAGILRKPAGTDRPPVVVMAMGLDSSKEEMESYESLFLARGLATLTFDGPGQGEGEYEFAIRHDYEVPVGAVLDWLELRDDVDAGRAGLWGVSLGGYYAARAAAFEHRLKACIGLSGPYNWGAVWDNLPDLTRAAFHARTKSASVEEARDKAHQLSLEGVAEKIICPLFVLAGKLDRLVPYTDAERLASEASGPVELLVVEDGNHIANNRTYRYRLQSADWMADQLR
ncbi:MAG: alpha/beta hydrolase [Rhodospirillaceae bacterium]|nr:alpha/beta hydrolase [Rhodospirillaceae bacterium]MBT5945046.1 alpha/beta hydrolase [Rhodospirillaceae bacterium]MBT6402873.1 alpha/beta hydrolase [Rhodospirillaceae bacterium]MBT6535765.1 alpha/beta hydrolase [Rhodospirillaceae bacterium]MBT7360505.1 alpha/beta hydrolase [Rhodospirillaceae bacterium]